MNLGKVTYASDILEKLRYVDNYYRFYDSSPPPFAFFYSYILSNV